MLQKRQNNDFILKDIRQFHTKMSLAGELPNDLLLVSDELLSYVLSLLRDEHPVLPEAVVDEWSVLLTHLQCHWIIPLLYWKIGHLPPELRPPEVICGRMREIFLASHVRYLKMERQLQEVLGAFNGEGIDVLIIRGPAIASTVYPEPATRPSSDIDLLLKPDQYLKARQVLKQLGYCSQIRRFEMLKELFSAEPFFHPTDGTKPFEIDLHWSLFHYHGIKRDNDVGEFFSRAETVETPGLTFQTLDPVDALVCYTFHLILHHAENVRLTWIYDIACLAQSLIEPDQWENLQKRASAFKLRLSMIEALKLAQLWNGLSKPERYRDLTKWLKPQEAERVELKYVTNKSGPDIRLQGYLESLRASPRKINYLLKLAFPDPDLMRITHPPYKEWLLPLSYIRRCWYWFGKLAQYLFHRWQRTEVRSQRAEGRKQMTDNQRYTLCPLRHALCPMLAP